MRRSFFPSSGALRSDWSDSISVGAQVGLRLTAVAILLMVIFLPTPGFASGAPLASGQTLSGTIGSAGASNFFTFSRTSGDRAIINAVTTSGALDTSIVLVSPTGAEESHSYGDDQLGEVLKESGTYTVVVEDYALTKTGTYSIELEKNPGTFVDDSYSTTINYGASYVYRATLTNGSLPLSGQRVVLETSTNGSTYVATSIAATSASDGTCAMIVNLTRNTWCRAKFVGTVLNGGCVSPGVLLT